MKEKLKKYDNEIYTLPYWQGQTVFHECLTFIKRENGKVSAKLLFTPTEVISLRSSSLKIEYQADKDYIVEGNEVIITEDSSIPVIEESEFFTDSESFPSKATNKNYTYFSNGELLKKQIAITYKHDENWDGYIPQYCGDKLPITTQKLAKGEKVKVVFIGDSITAMGDISGQQNCEPYMPRYSEMVAERIGELSASELEYKNLAIGGTSSNKYLEDENMKKEVYDFQPDLVVIAYGMNDGGWLKPERFVQNISSIIDDIKCKVSSAEFILVSTVIPNKDACWSNHSPVYIYQDMYEGVLQELEGQGVCVAKMTSIYNYLEQKKGFWSLTATGLNHPNDFTVRAYAQTILDMIFEKR